jgi:hypothetical protein
LPSIAPVVSKEMTPTAVAKVFADLDKHERLLRRTLDWDPSGGLFDVHRKIAGSPTLDLLTRDAATMLVGVGEHPAVISFVKGAEPLMDRAARGVADQLEEHGVGRVQRQREELEAKLMRATGQSLAHDIAHVKSPLLPKVEAAGMLAAGAQVDSLNPGGAAEAALRHEVGHYPFPEVASDPAALLAAPPDVATPIVDYRSPIVVRKRRSVEQVGPVFVPAELAEISAAKEARTNQISVEEFLRSEGLDYELEHFEVIPDRLISGSKPDRIHAAMSANLLFEGVANLVFPGQEEKYIDRYGSRRSVKNEDVRNRISAFIDRHLSEEMSSHEARRLQGKIDFAHKWSAKGHHVFYSAIQANLAYRDLLDVLAYVARARERSLPTDQPA